MDKYDRIKLVRAFEPYCELKVDFNCTSLIWTVLAVIQYNYIELFLPPYYTLSHEFGRIPFYKPYFHSDLTH